MSSNTPAPDDLVQVGYITGAFGLQGWVKIRPHSSTADALLTAKSFWFEAPAQGELRAVKSLSAKIHGDEVVARIEGVEDRNASEALKGTVVKISRQLFPQLPDDEFYWLDLIGLDVINLQGENLGVVRDMMDNGAQSILRVAAADVPDVDLIKHERLIPFVDHFVKEVLRDEKKIVVDWGSDY